MMNSASAPPSIPDELPVLPVSNVVIYPGMATPILIGRPSSVAAVDAALASDRLLAVFLQRDPTQEAVTAEDLHEVGTVVAIIKMMRLTADEMGSPTGLVQVLVHGLARTRAREWLAPSEESAQAPDGHLRVRLELAGAEAPKTPAIAALRQSLQATFSKVVDLTASVPDEIKLIAAELDEPGKVADYVAANLNLEVAERQEVLELFDVQARLERVNALANNQLAVRELAGKIQEGTRVELDKAQREYFLRQQLREIQKELGESDDQALEINELKEKIEAAQLPEEARKAADRELDRLTKMPPQAAEYTVSRTYLDWLVTLPWSVSTADDLDLQRAQQVLDEDHFDLADVKDRIIEYLAVRKLKQDTKGPILCLVGPPGVGKTSLGHSIARAVGRQFVRISLGGVRDEGEIRGHRRTYIGSLPGRIIHGVKTAGSNNPVFMLDEIDKLGADFRGDPSAALLEVLDPQQNNTFRDHYLEVPFDLSKVFFLTTANILDTIPPALLDRMEVLRLPGYTEDEKAAIATRYLLPRQMNEQGLTAEHIAFSPSAVRKIIRDYTREAGLRNLERAIASVCRKVARRVAESNGDWKKTQIRVTNLRAFLGPRKFERQLADGKDLVGVATGLAWTQAGGEILFIETAQMRGGKGLRLTGQLGEVMQESAHTALSYLRAHADELGLKPGFFDKLDIHVHVPAGAIPKDGPSAGVAMVTALASLLTNRQTHKDVAMTGEISLTGRVLPVGGIKEKVLAAQQAGIKKVILPESNRNDIEEVPAEARRKLRFVFVREISEALKHALDSDRPANASRSVGKPAK